MSPADPDGNEVGKLLCIGHFPYDVVHLVSVARRVRERLGFEAVFVSVAPTEVAADVRQRVSTEGFEALDRSLMAKDDPSVRNPFRRYRRQRLATLGLMDELLAEVRPTAVISTVNPPPGLFLDEAARRGVPTVLLQLFHWGDRSSFRDRLVDERRQHDARKSVQGRLKRRVERRIQAFYGVGPHVEWDLREAKIAVQGPGLRRRLVAERVPSENVVVTGNPALDDLHRLRHSLNAARDRLRARLGLPENARVITQTRTYEDRLLTLDRNSRTDSQVRIIQALGEAAPEAQVVVKIHPREGDAVEAFVRSIDPGVLVVGEELPTNELIAASDVVVSTASTTLLHAVVLDRPTVSVWLWPGLDYLRRSTAWSAVDRVDSPGALTESVRRHLHNPQYQAEWQARRDAFIKEEYLLDGQGTSRVVDLVERLTREPTNPLAVSQP